MYCEDDISTMNILLVLSNQADGSIRELPISLPFLAASRELRLNQALDDTCRRVLPLHGSQLFHVDFANRVNRFLGVYPFQSQIMINYESVFNGSVQIIVKPSQIFHPSPSEIKEEDTVVTNGKSKKVKQRTIEEALQSVKLWRKLYDTDDGSGKRLYTLDQAARIVGIAKKTLDDYYSLIRTAMNFNFNLQKFREQKIGILRKFVKISKEQGQEGINSKMSHCLCDMDIDKFWVELSDL